MTGETQRSYDFDKEVTLLDFFFLFWEGKRSIIAITLVFSLISIYIALDSDEVFISTGVLQFVEKDPIPSSSLTNVLNLNSQKKSKNFSIDLSLIHI